MTSSKKAAPKRKKWLLIGGIGVVVIALGVTLWLAFRPATPTATVRTRTATVTRTTEVVTVGVSGTLAPRNQASLSFASAGTVTTVKVKVGQKVSQGQALARIDNTDLANAVELAAANLTTARSQYSDAVDNDASSSQLSSARAQVRSAEASLASAQSALKKATLRSTIDGVVALVNVAKGDTVTGSGGTTSQGGTTAGATATTADVVVVDTKSWKVDATVGAADVGSLKKGQAAKVAITGTTTVLDAKVSTVGIVSTATGGAASFPVTLNLAGKGTGVYSGVAVTATITAGNYPEVLTVPTAAIQFVAGKTTVLQTKDGQQVATDVTTGRVFGSNTEITGGLTEGEEVLIQTRAVQASAGADGIQFGGPGMGGGGGGGQPPANPPSGGTGNR